MANMTRSISAVLTTAALTVSSSTVLAQQPIEDYLHYIPLDYPRLTTQTDASAQFHLFGDRRAASFVDTSPRDGIDDRRNRVLMSLATRSGPFMVQNTYSAPVDFRRLMRMTPVFNMNIDTWDLAFGPELVGRETVNMNAVGSEPCLTSNTGSADCRVVDIMRRYDPESHIASDERSGSVRVDTDRFEAIYFDMPGTDPASWRSHYENPVNREVREEFRRAVRAYVHPFIHAIKGEDGSVSGYEFYLQYWFYYPLNDGGNNHEGDWEHINVAIGLKDRIEGLLTHADIEAILDGTALAAGPESELVIKKVEYYFHHKLIVLDYSAPNVYLPRDEWLAQAEVYPRERIGIRKFQESIRSYAYRDEEQTIVNTHPIAYIGADNKGLDQLLSPPGGTNQDSHGTFPFPGLYKNIGPTGSAEQIVDHFDHVEWFEAGGDHRAHEAAGSGHAIHFADASIVEVVPDWEVVRPLVLRDHEIRRRWAWLVLPVRWGYPATPSPLAGLVPNADMGNVGPIGPAFNNGWNRPGEGRGFESYLPHVMPSIFPVDPQDAFSNSLGYFNVIPALTNLPPFDLAWRLVALPFRALFKRQDPIYFPAEEVPSRFVGIDVAATYVTPDEQMWFTIGNLDESTASEVVEGVFLPPQLLDIADMILGLDSTGAEGIPAIPFDEGSWAFSAGLTFFLGERFSSTTSISHSRIRTGFDQPLSTGVAFAFRGEINWWDISGRLRYNLATGGFKPHVILGYGMNMYRIENMTGNGTPLNNPRGTWIRNAWPLTWNYGFGGELRLFEGISPPPRGIDAAIRVALVWQSSPTGIELPGVLNIESLREVPTRWNRRVVELGGTLSF